jgi:CO/xanthine dehydrogenase Mo-binding subunit
MTQVTADTSTTTHATGTAGSAGSAGTTGKLNHVGTRRTGLTNVELALGKGTFVSDVQLPDMAHAAILRSPHAHARITSIDTSAAEALDGVLYVMTGREAEEAMRPIPEAWDT